MIRAAAAMLLAGALAGSAQAGSLVLCDAGPKFSAEEQDRVLRFSARVKAELEASGAAVAVVARSGLDLARFGQRYSHAGISLRAADDSRWAVRQLYFACEDRAPRLFDQGLAAFVLGLRDPGLGYVSLLLLPAPAAQALERSALDKRLALQLLGERYSANAYPFDTRYQNCNQWVAELLAAALGAAADRAQAQHWLRGEGYAPTLFSVAPWLWWVGGFVPWLHDDDQPAADQAALRYRVSMPASIDDFVRQTVAGARRIELCHDGRQVVLHRGWTPVEEGCRPGPGDEVVPL